MTVSYTFPLRSGFSVWVETDSGCAYLMGTIGPYLDKGYLTKDNTFTLNGTVYRFSVQASGKGLLEMVTYTRIAESREN